MTASHRSFTLVSLIIVFVSVNTIGAVDVGGIVKIVPRGEPQDAQEGSAANVGTTQNGIKGRSGAIDLTELMNNLMPASIQAQFMYDAPSAVFQYFPTEGADHGIDGDGWHGRCDEGTSMNIVRNARTGSMTG